MNPLVQIMYSALAESMGLLCWSPDPPLARAAFYRARQKAQDPDLFTLEFRLLPDNQIAITKAPDV